MPANKRLPSYDSHVIPHKAGIQLITQWLESFGLSGFTVKYTPWQPDSDAMYGVQGFSIQVDERTPQCRYYIGEDIIEDGLLTGMIHHTGHGKFADAARELAKRVMEAS